MGDEVKIIHEATDTLRRAMAVVIGLMEMDGRNVPSEDHPTMGETGRTVRLVNDQWRKKRDKLLADNGFRKEK